MQVLLTGSTGFVGSELMRTLLLSPDLERLILLVRPQAGVPPLTRLEKLRSYWSRYLPVPSEDSFKKVQLIDYDLDHPNLPAVTGPVDYLIHSAATTDLDPPLAVARRANLYTTQKALALARSLPGLRRFVHLSTAYVSGCRRGVIHEDTPVPDRFHNNYERSKLEAESCVRTAGVPYTIVRPSIIVGRSDNGYVYRMKVLYSVWRIWLAGVIPRAPVDPKSWIDIVPVDFVVAATLALMQNPAALGEVVHLCAGPGRQSPADLMHAATRVFGVPTPPLSPPWVVDLLRLPFVRPFVAHTLRETLDRMHAHVPYIGMRDRLFSMEKAAGLLGGISCPEISAYSETLFHFCKETAWGKRPWPSMREPAAAQACSA